MNEIVLDQARRAKAASRKLASVGTELKNKALLAIADSLNINRARIQAENAIDLKSGRAKGVSEALLDRLMLDDRRIEAMAEGLRQIATLPDPVGEMISGVTRPNGLEMQKIRVPLGVIGIIYESRPNVTIDAAGLCLKAGNATILRGGSEAIRSNLILCKLCSEAAEAAGLPADTIQMIATTDRDSAITLMQAEGLVDLLIPRGGENLKKSVLDNARVPVLASLGGNCHTFVDASANLKMAEEIAFNAKVSRPSVCNAMETLLVHSEIAERLLPALCQRLELSGVELRGCERTRKLVSSVCPATESDWETEYHALILAIKVVDSLDDAIEHITKYGSSHSEAIVTENYSNAQRFTREIDAACVYVNASTRFTDGFEFGMGAEVGISTQKLHARGPVGLNELTTTKTIVRGQGQVRR